MLPINILRPPPHSARGGLRRLHQPQCGARPVSPARGPGSVFRARPRSGCLDGRASRAGRPALLSSFAENARVIWPACGRYSDRSAPAARRRLGGVSSDGCEVSDLHMFPAVVDGPGAHEVVAPGGRRGGPLRAQWGHLRFSLDGAASGLGHGRCGGCRRCGSGTGTARVGPIGGLVVLRTLPLKDVLP